MDVKEILRHVDHTLLAPTATWEEIRQICDDGIKYGCASVCIPQTYVAHAAHYIAEQQHYGFGQLPVCTVIGFPNGYVPSGIKCMEAESAVADGATEIDMVINLGWVKEGQYDKILQEINSVKISCHGNILKVIIETCMLTDEEKIKLCEVVSNSAADYIKTSTGFGGGGATREDVALMAAHMTNGKKIKAAGGIANLQDAEDFLKLGADPLRAKFIAETFLENPQLVNNVRGVQGYTGTYKGVRVSVMASGMGIPSIAIYSNELYTHYGVENIIRVGSAGAMRADMELGSVCAGMGACTNSSFADQYELGATYAPICNYDLLAAAVESANELGVKMPVGNLYSSDTFYDAAGRNARFGKMGILAVEMEAAGLYCTAAYAGKRALAICSISDNLVTGKELSADERQTTFTNMMKIALEVAVKMENKE